ncbi:MAG TPA: glutamyl-tRNA reductase [Pyrinomonadaceae bacterium]
MGSSLYVFGLNHKTAPVELRERLAFPEHLCRSALRVLKGIDVFDEALIISTCNRVEIIVVSWQDYHQTKARVATFLSEIHKIPVEEFMEHCYLISGMEASRHLFKVTSSLDSMVIGEQQISGQVRKAYALAVEMQTVGRCLHKLMHHAFHIAKRVHTEVFVRQNPTSLALAAVEMSKSVLGNLENKTILLIGAGQMAELTVQHLLASGCRRIIIANRDSAKAEKLANKFGGDFIDFSSIAESLARTDIIFCSTSSENFVISAETIQKSGNQINHPILLIDLGLPRNIDPQVGGLDNLYLYNLDDLKSAAAEVGGKQENLTEKAESIIADESEKFQQSLLILDIGQRIGSLREKLHNTARNELLKRRKELGELSPEQERAIENILISAVNKISHPILYGLKRSQSHSANADLIGILDGFLAE